MNFYTIFPKRLAAHVVMGLTLFTIPAGIARADLLYADDFDGPSGVPLDGYAPDTRTGTFGTSDTATWAAGVQYNADGTMWSSPNNSLTARLPFTPVAGEIYELSADFEGLSTWVGQQEDWISLAFFDSSTPYAWMRIGSHSTGSGREVEYLSGGVGTNGTVATTLGVKNLKIVLDTQDTNWSVDWFLDDTQVGSTYTFTANPSITHVGFGRVDNARSNFDNFQLSVVPEPSSLLLVLTSGLTVLLLRRREP